FIPAATLMMMFTHRVLNLLAVRSGLEPGAIDPAPGKTYQLRYNERKLTNMLRERGIDRDGIQPMKVSYTYANLLEAGVDADMSVEEKLNRYLQIIVSATVALAGEYEIKLNKPGPTAGSEKRVLSYLNKIYSGVSSGRKQTIVENIEKLIYDPRASLDINMGNVGALSVVDADKLSISIDAGILGYFQSPESVEMVLAAALAHSIFARLGGAGRDDKSSKTELTVKIRDAKYAKTMFTHSREALGVDTERLSRTSGEISRFFQKIRAYDDIPFTAFNRVGAAAQKFGITGMIDDRYKPVAVLGEGGMGVVFLAFDAREQEPVAVKVAKIPPENSEAHERRFEREITISREVSEETADVVKIFTNGVIGELESRNLYYAMKYYPWPTLKDVIADEEISVPMAVDVTIRVLKVLRVLHDKGLTHRDIKPENIMISPDRKRVILMDFGLIKDIHSQTMGVTMSGAAMGSPHYMAPEQGKDAKSVDHRADLYSAGVMLYEMVTGQKPYTGSTPMEIVMTAMQSEATSPEKLNPAVDNVLRAVIAKGMAKDRVKRYKNAQGFIQTLEDWEKKKGGKEGQERKDRRKHRQEARPGAGRRVSGPRRAERPASRGVRNRRPAASSDEKSPVLKWGFILGGGLMLMVIAAVTFFSSSGNTEKGDRPDRPDNTEERVTVDTGTPETTRENTGREGTDDSQDASGGTTDVKPLPAGAEAGGAIEFTEKGQYIDFGKDRSLANIWDNGGTISFWMRADSILSLSDYKGVSTLISKGERKWYISLHKNHGLVFAYGDGEE
ncbi:MAG: protein kinase, partial [Candidatus Omnitrophica bacterium]|nr:protein kinase [Candidatus Omnitrophota bacterium]